MSIITSTLQNISIQEGQTHKNLSVFSLTHAPETDPGYIILDEAIQAKSVHIRETSESGTVPFIRLENQGAVPVFLLDGEELVGAKQNRILNLTILAPAKRTIDIPVSCVEVGRWAHNSDRFASADRAVYASLRAQKTVQVSASLAVSGQRHADQGAIWENIESKSDRMRAVSSTGAMDGMYENYESHLLEFNEKFVPTKDQVGAIFATNGEVVGLDLFDHPSTYSKLCSKLLRSYALDALDSSDEKFALPSKSVGEDFVAELINQTDEAAFPAIGEGTDIRLSGPGLTGSALHALDNLVHLCAFRLDQAEGSGRRDMASRISRRAFSISRNRRQD